MDKIIIPQGLRAALKKTLSKYGVDRFSLFPGLDSLAAHIEWLQSKGYSSVSATFETRAERSGILSEAKH